MEIGNPQSFNRYSYVSGDPINFVDPSGLLMICRTYSQWTWINIPSPDGSPNAVGTLREWTECTQLFGGGGGSGIFTYQPQPTISIEGSGSGGGLVNTGSPQNPNRSNERERQQRNIEKCAKQAMQKARKNIPSIYARLEIGGKGALIAGFLAVKSGPGAALALGLGKSMVRVTKINSGGFKAIGGSVGGTLGSIVSGNVLWEALKDSTSVLNAIEMCRKENPLGQLSNATLARIALSAF